MRKKSGILHLLLSLSIPLIFIACKNNSGEDSSSTAQTTLTAFPRNPSNASFAIFGFRCDQADCRFECQMDEGGWTDCCTGQTYTRLSEDNHVFEVRSINSDGMTETTHPTWQWLIDLTAPRTFFDSTPAEAVNSPDAVFEFSCNEAICQFECRLDSGPWSPCISPATVAGLAEGSHSFQVRAMDAAGNVDQNPSSYSWAIDSTPPDTAISYGPSNPTRSMDASFGFACNESSCGFECRLDAGTWTACGSPQTYSSLSEGSHAFQVRAIDRAGNIDPSPANYAWSIDRTPPDTNITSKPTDPTTSTSASFSFSCTETSCSFECQLDAGAWSACSSPASYTGLSVASHTFQVRAIDLAGNVDSGPASYTWQIRQSNSWLPTSTVNAPSARYWHTAVWTGSQMIIWGGIDGSGYLNTGGRYDPTTDSWSPTSTGVNVPSERVGHTAIWTDSEMIIWGGVDWTNYLNTGGRYDPTTDSWSPTSTGVNVPSARCWHTAVWTGTEMIVWAGGVTYTTPIGKTGGIYNPVSNSWTALSTTGAPRDRCLHTAVWTGREMIVWGGIHIGFSMSDKVVLADGGKYNPETNTWLATSATGAPQARAAHTAVWTGTEMIIWGGMGVYWIFPISLNSGSRYNPATNSWNATNTWGAPSARGYLEYFHTAVWTGTKMIIWGGNDGTHLNTGGLYDPAANSWASTSLINAPAARSSHTAIWTGSQMIIWGGYDGTDCLNSGGRYVP